MPDLKTWGSALIDLRFSRVYRYPGAISGPETFSQLVNEVFWDKKYMEKQLVPKIKARLPDSDGKGTSMGLQSSRNLPVPAISRAAAVASSLSDWHNGLRKANFTSLVVRSEGLQCS